MKSVIGESEDEILRRVRREALEGIRRLNQEPPLGPGYSPEFGPGLFFEDLGIQFAGAKKRRKQSNGGLA